MNVLMPALVAETLSREPHRRVLDRLRLSLRAGRLARGDRSDAAARAARRVRQLLRRPRAHARVLLARYGTPGRLIRLNYAIDLRYGVLLDVASKVLRGEPIDLAMGHVNVIWQGDANAMALRALLHCTTPTSPLNVSGPETISIRWLARGVRRAAGQGAAASGRRGGDRLADQPGEALALFGYPVVPLGRMIDWVADWVARGGRSLGKETHYDVRDGSY